MVLQFRKRIEMFKYGSAVIQHSIENVRIMKEIHEQEMIRIEKIIAKQNSVLKFIYKLDKYGENLDKNLLFVRLSHINNLPEIYYELLCAGEIFEVNNVVYPIETKNDILKTKLSNK